MRVAAIVFHTAHVILTLALAGVLLFVVSPVTFNLASKSADFEQKLMEQDHINMLFADKVLSSRPVMPKPFDLPPSHELRAPEIRVDEPNFLDSPSIFDAPPDTSSNRLMNLTKPSVTFVVDRTLPPGEQHVNEQLWGRPRYDHTRPFAEQRQDVPEEFRFGSPSFDADAMAGAIVAPLPADTAAKAIAKRQRTATAVALTFLGLAAIYILFFWDDPATRDF